jgi:hypothetical protein
MKTRRSDFGVLTLALGIVFAVGLGASPASADIIFSDFGPSLSYDCCTGYAVAGSGRWLGSSATDADEFTTAAGGAVAQIDLAVGYFPTPDGDAPPSPYLFYASIWTDVNGLPGSQLARWDDLYSTTQFLFPSGVVTISGISGLYLDSGQSYFMVLGPMDLTDTSWNVWNYNDQGVTGLALSSADGGTTWNNNTTLGAFDIVVPEPASLLLLGTGLAVVVAAKRRRR